jgi:hypothetical protein
MSNVQKGDIFVVSRNGTEFQVKNEDTSNLRDDDLFWVQRNGVNYSVTADQVTSGEGAAAPELNSVQLTQTTTGDRFTDQSFLTAPLYTTSGNPIPTVGLKGEVTGALSLAGATDEIVGNEVDIIYSDYCAGGINPSYPPTRLFDGNIVTEAESLQNETVTFIPPKPITGSTIRIHGIKSGDASSSLKVNGDELSTLFSNGAWEWVTLPGVTEITSLSYKRGSSPNVIALTAIEVDGTILIDGSGNTLLTLASDVNLTNGVFKAGDVVKQDNSPIIPTSSTITNVGNEISTVVVEVGGTTVINPENLFIDGQGVTITNNNTGKGVRFNCAYCGISGGTSVTVNAANQSGLNYKLQGQSPVQVTTSLPGGDYQFTLGGSNSDLLEYIEVVKLSDGGSLAWYSVNFAGTSAKAPTLLTLTNSDGLDDFKVGDVIQPNPEWWNNQVFSAGGTGARGDRPWSQCFDGSLTTIGGTANNASTAKVTFATPIYTTKLRVYGYKDAGGDAPFYPNGGTDCSKPFNQAPARWHDITYSLPEDKMLTGFTSVKLGHDNEIVTYAIEVNNRILIDCAVPDVNEARVMSVDPLEPSITTNTGSWIGTDGTTSPGTWVQSEIWSNYFTTPASFPDTESRAFDGTLAMQGGYWTNECKWQPATPIRYYDKVEIFCGIGQRYHSNDEGSYSDFPPNVWGLLRANPNGDTGDLLTSIEVERPGGTTQVHTFSGLRIDGHLYVDTGIAGQPGETFVVGPSEDITATYVSSDPSVPSMTVSDVVGPWSANTGNYVVNTVVNPVMVKPETSAIAGVGSSSGATALMYGMDRGISNLADVLANGTLLQGGEPMPAYLVVVHQGLAKAGENVWQANGSGAFSIPDPAGGHFDADGNRLGGDGNYNEAEWTGFFYQNTNADTYTVSLDAAYTVFTRRVAGTIPATTQGDLTVLTLTDNTDLNQFVANEDVYANESFTPVTPAIVNVSGNALTFASSDGLNNFRVGDVVGGLLDQSEVWSNLTYNDNNSGRTWESGYEPIKAFGAYPVTGKCVTNGSLLITQPVSAIIGIGGVEFNTVSSSTQDFKIYYNGQVVEGGTTSGNWTSSTYAGPIDKVSVKCNGNNTQFTSILVNGKQLINTGVSAPDTIYTVTNIAPNFMEVSGGTWNVGDVVTGPLIPPATGTVASTDPAGNTMTFSTSSGRWIYGTKVTMDEKPALSSTASLNFDANGAVSGISAGNPDYVNMNSNTPLLNFPSTFSDGQTPDETIPEGAYIQTDVRAWNETGESIMKSNKVTPETTTRLAKGETKLIDGYTPVATAAARQTLAEAHKIENNITRASDNLKLTISEYEEQGKRRSV